MFPSFLQSAAPVVSFRHPRAEPPAQVGSVAQRGCRRALPRRDGPAGSPALPGSPPAQTPGRGTGRPWKPRGAGHSPHSGLPRVRVRSAALPGRPRCSELGPPRPPSASVPRGQAAPSARLHSPRRHLVSPFLQDLERVERPPRGGPHTLRPGRQLPSAPLLAPAARTHHTKSPSRRLTAAILPPNHRRRTGGREHQLAPAPPIGVRRAT